MHASLTLLAQVAAGNACCDATRVDVPTTEAATTSASLSACASACASGSASASVSASVSPSASASASASVSASIPSTRQCVETKIANGMTMQTASKSCSLSFSQVDTRNVAMSQTLLLAQSLAPTESATCHVTTSTGVARRRAQACSRPRPQMAVPSMPMQTGSILSPLTDGTAASGASPKSSPVSVPMRPDCMGNSMTRSQRPTNSNEDSRACATRCHVQVDGRIGNGGAVKRDCDNGATWTPPRRAQKRRLESAEQGNARPTRAPRRCASPVVSHPSTSNQKTCDDGGSSGASPADDSRDSVDVKKAMRAERNRQSAAASRERKKKHMKELEERVKKSDEEIRVLRYQWDAEKRQFQERERCLESEIARLRNEIISMGQSAMASEMAGGSSGVATTRRGQETGGSGCSTPAAHAMAMHRLTNSQNVPYK